MRPATPKHSPMPGRRADDGLPRRRHARIAAGEPGMSDMSRHRGDEALIGGHLARIEGRDDDPARWIAAAEAFPSDRSGGCRPGIGRRRPCLRRAPASRSCRRAVTGVRRAVEIGARPLAGRSQSLRAPEAHPAAGAGATRDRQRILQPRARTRASGNRATRPSEGEASAIGRSRSSTLVAAGYSNGQIADRLFISPKTASVHVSHILDKLGASSRTEAATIGVRLGLA